MQARAIFEAALDGRQGDRQRAGPGDHDPAGRHAEGAGDHAARRSTRWPRRCSRETGTTIEYSVGTMIELPRAALTADEIAEDAEFFCFGTNDLTQTTFGLSRDDAGKFLPAYVERGHPAEGPVRLDRRRGRRRAGADRRREGPRDQEPDLKLGICGEHGGDPASVEFCQEVGLDYVSCCPYRVPVARLAAAQAALGVAADRTA